MALSLNAAILFASDSIFISHKLFSIGKIQVIDDVDQKQSALLTFEACVGWLFIDESTLYSR